MIEIFKGLGLYRINAQTLPYFVIASLAFTIYKQDCKVDSLNLLLVKCKEDNANTINILKNEQIDRIDQAIARQVQIEQKLNTLIKKK